LGGPFLLPIPHPLGAYGASQKKQKKEPPRYYSQISVYAPLSAINITALTRVRTILVLGYWVLGKDTG